MSAPALSLAAGLRHANWPMVAEFMEPVNGASVAVYVSTSDEARELCRAIRKIPHGEAFYSEVEGATMPLWKVIRRR